MTRRKHTRRCTGSAIHNDLLDHGDVVIARTTRQCLTCGMWLGMGPANDEGPPGNEGAVRVEIRAAELEDLLDARGRRRLRLLVPMTQAEWVGWVSQPCASGVYEPAIAGHLARAIHDHEDRR